MKTLFKLTPERGIILFLALFLSTSMLSDKTSSCPFVYAYDGEKYVKQGELYAGMVGSNLADFEYFPLSALQAEAGHYRLRISNESDGKQFIDMAHLMVVQHPAKNEILVDKRGKAHLIGKTQKPISTSSNNGTDLSDLLSTKDQQVFSFDNEDNTSRNAVLLKFKKPERTDRGKLILTAQSTDWMDQMVEKYYQKFGKDFPTWLKDQNELSTPERLQGIRDNDLPLTVYLRNGEEWERLEYFLPTSPNQFKTFVVPINVRLINGSEIELKVETGFKFWELDFAAMDFTPNTQVSTTFVQPDAALDQDKTNLLSALENTDLKFMSLKKRGDFVEIQFPEVQAENSGYSFFLYTNGYYELNPTFEGVPEVNEIKKLQVPGALSDFSKTEYLKTKAQPKVM